MELFPISAKCKCSFDGYALPPSGTTYKNIVRAIPFLLPYYEIVRGHVALFIKRLLFPVVVFVLSPWGELSSTYFC